MIVSSNDYLVWVDSVQVANVQSVSLSYNLSTVEVTTQRTNGYRESISDTRTVTISFDALLDEVDLDRFNLGDRIATRFGTTDTSFQAEGGFITSIEQTSGTDDVPRYSVTIETTGDVTAFTVLTFLDLCTNDGTPICTDQGEPLCVSFRVELVLRELCDNNENVICADNGEPLCLNVPNTIQ